MNSARAFLIVFATLLLAEMLSTEAFTVHRLAPQIAPTKITSLQLNQSKLEENKFDFGARIESAKSGVVGLLAGGIGLAPFSAFHNIFVGGGNVVNGVGQWEFDTDMGALEGALFAIVFRYCIRMDSNPMLNQGVIGTFILLRVLSKIQVPSYCSAAPLDCGSPLGYFDWSMLIQAGLTGIESTALFGAASLAMEYCFERGIISKFR